MSKPKVFYANLRAHAGYNLLDKFGKLITAAGIFEIDFENQFTAVKMHFGEPGNLAYIRHNYAKKLIDMLKIKKAKVFLTDANTLYKGRRSDAVSHLESAFENGFNPITVGCNVIIADGLKGTEFREIEINKKHCKTAKIGSAIADSDIIISLAHFKGHEMTGIGGALKNIGMGSGSIQGKQEMHSGSKPVIIKDICTGCRVCVNNCNKKAISIDSQKKAEINYDLCVGCGQCIAVCRFGAAQSKNDSTNLDCGEKLCEYAYAVLKDKPAFYINLAMDISPECDCWGFNDAPISEDIGMFASFDPVAIDQACADMTHKAKKIEESRVHDMKPGEDKFYHVHPDTSWREILDYAEKLGLGSREYELIKID